MEYSYYIWEVTLVWNVPYRITGRQLGSWVWGGEQNGILDEEIRYDRGGERGENKTKSNFYFYF